MPQRDFVHTETLRLAAVHKGDLLDTPIEARYNRIVRVARRALAVRAATISLLDEDREWVKAADGWDLRELPLAHSLVATLLKDGNPVIIPDTLLDARCRRHHLVTRSPKVRFCALYPLRDRTERLAGALAVYDIQPLQLPADFLALLGDLGQLAQREMFLVDVPGAQEQLLSKLSSARRQALLDELTRVWNRRGGIQLLERAIADSARHKAGLGVCIADLDRFKEVNDNHGHAIGDLLLKKVASALVDALRPGDVVCRLGGEEFLLIVPDVTLDQMTDVLDRMRKRISAQTVRVQSGTASVTVSVGGILKPPPEAAAAEELIRKADAALYRAKGAGRNVVVAAKA